MFSIKIEILSLFMFLDCVCEDFFDILGIYMCVSIVMEFGVIIWRNVGGYKKVFCLEFDFYSFFIFKNFFNFYCLEVRMEFYRIFFFLIKLLLVYK